MFFLVLFAIIVKNELKLIAKSKQIKIGSSLAMELVRNDFELAIFQDVCRSGNAGKLVDFGLISPGESYIFDTYYGNVSVEVQPRGMKNKNKNKRSNKNKNKNDDSDSDNEDAVGGDDSVNNKNVSQEQQPTNVKPDDEPKKIADKPQWDEEYCQRIVNENKASLAGKINKSEYVFFDS